MCVRAVRSLWSEMLAFFSSALERASYGSLGEGAFAGLLALLFEVVIATPSLIGTPTAIEHRRPCRLPRTGGTSCLALLL